ncbi:MAG: hypothetical protein KDH09_08295 [Chrysiogenetes bacterium]|nr:hypothetical protein [Chrysiogenetes bacterium]
MKRVFPDLRFRGLVVFILLCLAGTSFPTAADAQAVSAEHFSAELAQRLGYRAPFVPESERGKVLREFLAGKSHEDLPPQGFLTATPNIALGSEQDPNNPKNLSVVSPSATGEVEYSFFLIRPGQLRAEGRVRGGTQLWQINEAAPIALHTGGEWSQVELPPVWLEAGEHRLRIAVPAGGEVGSLRVHVPCVQPILPEDLQGSAEELNFADKTTAMIRAFDREDLLPDADEPPTTVSAEEYDAAGSEAQMQGTGDTPYLESAGGVSKAVFIVDVKQQGVYTLKAMIAGGGASSWDVNGCRVSSMPPARRASQEFSEEVIGSVLLNVGPQKIEIALRPGLKLASLSLQRKKTDPGSYAKVAENLGLSEGAPGDPVTEAALLRNLSSPLLAERRRTLEDTDEDPAGLSPGSDQFVFKPTPGPDDNGDGDGLPSDDQDEPYHSPVSPYLPDPLSGAGAL